MNQKLSITILLLMAGLAGLGISGCNQENKTAAPTPAAMQESTAPAQPATTIDPAAAKPKDHPAH